MNALFVIGLLAGALAGIVGYFLLTTWWAVRLLRRWKVALDAGNYDECDRCKVAYDGWVRRWAPFFLPEKEA